MKIISFDIGIKNMAYCILEFIDEKITIVDWNVLNLLNLETTSKNFCEVKVKNNKKKNEEKVCGKEAKFKNENFYCCLQHAKSNKQFMMPEKHHSEKVLKQKKLNELQDLCKKHMLFIENQKSLKKDIVENLRTFFKKHALEKIQTTKKITAGETDLISIGKNMKNELDMLSSLDSLDVVFIENQISPIANRMKTIQGMLAQYFIMKNENINIEFVSSSHKLKQFDKDKNSYKENKQQGVLFSKKIIDSNSELTEWRTKLDTKKADDLADCFLQGIYYFYREKNIYYADDLKIKIV